MSYRKVEYYLNLDKPREDDVKKEEESEGIVMENVSTVVGSTADPRIWGPGFWFSLHNSAEHYPHNPSPIVRDRTKGRILAISYEIPCQGCRPHSISYIENADLDKAVSSKENLIRFYVDFHNQVNKRYNKPLVTYEQARKMYGGNVTYIKYK